MQGSFLSTYESKLADWEQKIKNDPRNRSMYESEMSDYIIACIPYLNQYSDDIDVEETTDNFFGARETKGLQKRDIYTDYLVEVEKLNVPRPVQRIAEVCTQCEDEGNVVHFPDTSELVCDRCGMVISVLISEELTYREEQETSSKVVSYSYKRENHFSEWLSQLQAQEMTTIPDEVLDQLREEFKKLKITDVTKITQKKVRALLKKLKLNKFYEHVPHITNTLTNLRPPRLSQVLEEKLRLMFKDIQIPFDKHCPSDRKNFLSYSYVLYKFCELLSEDEYLPLFPLLKSKEKLFQQDCIWKEICKELRWEYIPTI